MSIKFRFKIVVIGDGAVGKTSLIQKYTQGIFQEDLRKTIGAQFTKYVHEVNNEMIELLFWDIAGQSDFYFLRPAFYEGSSGAIIVFSLEDIEHGEKSVENIKHWHNDFKEHAGDYPVVLFGNKVDLVDEEELNEEKVLKKVKKRNFIGYYRTSAKTGQGVIDAFNSIIDTLYNKEKKR